MKLATVLSGQAFIFRSLKEVLAKANELKSGDVLAGVLVVLKGEIAFGGGIVRVFRGQMLDGCHTVHQPFLQLSAESS